MSEDDWTEWDAGPVSRPYALTGGRTRPRVELRFDLIDLIAWTGRRVDPLALSQESRHILDLCQSPVTVADLASALGLPLGVVRVLLGDLVHDGLIDVRVAAAPGRVTDQRLLARVLAGVQALLFTLYAVIFGVCRLLCYLCGRSRRASRMTRSLIPLFPPLTRSRARRT